MIRRAFLQFKLDKVRLSALFKWRRDHRDEEYTSPRIELSAIITENNETVTKIGPFLNETTILRATAPYLKSATRIEFEAVVYPEGS